MFLLRRNCAFRRIFVTVLAGLGTTWGWAQTSSPSAPPTPQPQQFVIQDYSKESSHFPNPIAPYMPHHVAPPDLRNTPRMESLMRDGKIYRYHAFYDLMDLARQLGIMPPTGSRAERAMVALQRLQSRLIRR